MPSIPIIIYPTPVQGKGVAIQIADAIQLANERAECDVLIICRGGGSIEDLWQFNEEIVARAITECSIPTISGIGHETDFTICDFVADVRAATPTAAAELATPSRENITSALNQLKQQLTRNIQYILNQRSQSLDYISRRLVSPVQQIEQQKSQLSQIAYRLNEGMSQHLINKHQNLIRLNQNLSHLNPQAVLTRGYAFVQNKLGLIITSSQQLQHDDKVKLTFGVGSANAIIE
jgi:exodeoxyribonuclease VII large subunit